MKKLFISQPMADKTPEYIKAERNHLIEVAKMYLKEDVEVLDSYFIEDVPTVTNEALYYLGKSLMVMSEADVVIFSREWKEFRGCKIEHAAANSYGIDIIESYSNVKF